MVLGEHDQDSKIETTLTQILNVSKVDIFFGRLLS